MEQQLYQDKHNIQTEGRIAEVQSANGRNTEGHGYNRRHTKSRLRIQNNAERQSKKTPRYRRSPGTLSDSDVFSVCSDSYLSSDCSYLSLSTPSADRFQSPARFTHSVLSYHRNAMHFKSFSLWARFPGNPILDLGQIFPQYIIQLIGRLCARRNP